jgi:hypothetical protein
MQRLRASDLQALGAPPKGGAQQIENWLRGLLQGGTIRLDTGVLELRGSEPVATTLGDLKSACGVAMETVKQGLRALELEHWVLLVDGVHTRLLGPPRFRVSVTKENLAGSVGRAIVIAPMEGLNPLESIDYDQLRQAEEIASRKRVLVMKRVTLHWTKRLRLAGGEETDLPEGRALTLAAGSQIRSAGRPGRTRDDLEVRSLNGREVRLSRPGCIVLEKEGELTLRSRARLQLERSNLIRLRDGRTGMLDVHCRAALDRKHELNWDDDSHWLGRFTDGVPLVLLRRVVLAELRGVVEENCVGVGGLASPVWRVGLGVHDCILDGSIPFRAGQCPLRRSPEVLMDFLQGLEDGSSLREQLAARFGFSVDEADVRLSPAMFAGPGLRELLRQVATDPALNSELLAIGNRVACWTQVGAYYRKYEAWPWEVTREAYFTFVDMRYRQQPG